jgi:hypothetical protein
MGLEPTNAGATDQCVNPFATTAIYKTYLAGAAGIEPTPKVLETFVLPLNYAPIWWRMMDSNHRTQREQIYSLPCLATSLILHDTWCRREDLNPQPTDYKSVALPIELQRHNIQLYLMVARDGIEPPTRGFSVLCSTD